MSIRDGAGEQLGGAGANPSRRREGGSLQVEGSQQLSSLSGLLTELPLWTLKELVGAKQRAWFSQKKEGHTDPACGPEGPGEHDPL